MQFIFHKQKQMPIIDMKKCSICETYYMQHLIVENTCVECKKKKSSVPTVPEKTEESK